MNSPDDRREWVLAALDRKAGFARDDARDVVQFVFLRLCDQSPDEIDDRLAQWLYTVCRNRALDVLKSNSREKANGRAAVGCEANHRTPGLPCGHPQPPSREIDPA